jgi:hypothetical protein
MQTVVLLQFSGQYFMQNVAKVQLLKIAPDAIFIGIFTILERNSDHLEK